MTIALKEVKNFFILNCYLQKKKKKKNKLADTGKVAKVTKHLDILFQRKNRFYNVL